MPFEVYKLLCGFQNIFCEIQTYFLDPSGAQSITSSLSGVQLFFFANTLAHDPFSRVMKNVDIFIYSVFHKGHSPEGHKIVIAFGFITTRAAMFFLQSFRGARGGEEGEEEGRRRRRREGSSVRKEKRRGVYVACGLCDCEWAVVPPEFISCFPIIK